MLIFFNRMGLVDVLTCGSEVEHEVDTDGIVYMQVCVFMQNWIFRLFMIRLTLDIH